jgi:hypothetical protein
MCKPCLDNMKSLHEQLPVITPTPDSPRLVDDIPSCKAASHLPKHTISRAERA